MKQRRSFRIALFFSILCRKIASKKTFAPPKRCPLAPPFIYRSHAAWYERKRMDRTRPGPFFRKKPPVSSIQAAFWLPTRSRHSLRPARAASRAKGLGGIGRTGPTMKGFAPCFRFAAESSRSVSALPQLGQGGQASSGPDHVFKLARAGRAIKIVHRHKGITPF